MIDIPHDIMIQLLKLLTAAAVAFGAMWGAIKVYLRGRAKLENGLLDKQKKLEEQKQATQKEREDAVNTHLTLLKDSVIALSAETRSSREIQAKQDLDINKLEKIVKDLRDTVGALSNRIREFLESQVDSNDKRTFVRAKKGT